MPKVMFGYDRYKDAWSWVQIAQDRDENWGTNWRKENAHITHELLDQILNATKEEAIEIVLKHFDKSPYQKYKEEVIGAEIASLEKIWRTKEKEYFDALEKITGKPIYQKKFTCYFTTGFMCPYSRKDYWFMVSVWKGIPFQITTICHEILHLQFQHYWWKIIVDNLGEIKADILKESLTFLLNEDEFDSIILSEDQGYKNHQELRKELSNFWQKTRDFEELVKFGIKYLS